MSLLINIPSRPIAKLVELLKQRLPEEEIEIWPDVRNPESVEMALLWLHESGSLQAFPNLKALHSFGAGVDSILTDPKLPELPIARLVDPKLARDMACYITTMIQQNRLRLAQFRTQQSTHVWKPKSPIRHNRVGILGLGELGQKAAKHLNQQGFEVLGWSRSQKNVDDVRCFSGHEGLKELAGQSDYLVCLLPLTDETQGILNRTLFSQMPNHAVLINVARGHHLVEEDLITALDAGEIDAAILDVFRQEPLSSEHPFWSHAKITITPHISAVTDIHTALDQIVANYQRVKAGQMPMNTIDLAKGY